MSGKHLNTKQLEAVKHGEGSLLIIAGAGTGKTTVITERVKYLITEKNVPPAQILALTFTEKAATEMEGRIDEALPLGFAQMWVMTFHGFCDHVLKQDGFHIGLDTNYRLMTTADSVDLLRRNLYELGLEYFAPLGNPNKFLYGLLSHFSRLQDENITADEYLNWTDSLKESDNPEENLEIKKWKELSYAFKKYEEIKIKNSLFDFGDLITKTILLFTKRPNVLSQYQDKFRYILVDEFQDTNFAQNILVQLLSQSHGNITVVGDDDQSIYRFRGASTSNMLQFKKYFPQASIVTLTENYRSKQNILDTAHTVISNNNPDRLEVIEKIDKRLVSALKGDGVIEYCAPHSSLDEADFVTQKIIELHKNKDIPLSDFAILVRANSHADIFVGSLESSGVPYQFLGPGKLFLEPEIQDLISYLKVVSDIHDNTSLYRILTNTLFNIDVMFLSKKASEARHTQQFLFDVLKESDNPTVSNLLEVIEDHIIRSRNESAPVLLLDFLNRSGLKDIYLKTDTAESERAAKNIQKFFSRIQSFESSHADSSIQSLVSWIELQIESNESPSASEVEASDENKVNILTVHAAKGLEFPVVFLVNLVSQRFPSMERREQIPIPEELIREVLPKGDFHLQEERRLFYVGVTRAKEYLYLTGAKFYGDGKREKKLSPFVAEALFEKKPLRHVKEESQIKVAKKERPKKSTKIKKISYSHIETFKVCPLHYKLSYIMNLPTPPTPSQSFGISFHNTLREFHSRVNNNESPSVDLLHEILKRQWKREGYVSLSHLEKSYKKAEKFLEIYFKEWFGKLGKPLCLEESFCFKLDNFSVVGKIDRIDETPHGIHIIDYKTGANAMTQKDADRNLQLSMYALAATKIPHPPYNRDPKDITLSLLYFDTNEIVTTKRTKEQLRAAEEEIVEWVRKIETSNFECSGNFLCYDCEYKAYCAASLGAVE